MAESEGATFERFDLARRERPLELLVNAAFIFNPQQHAALAVEHEDASEDEYVDEKVDFTRLRKPVGAPADGVLDLVVDVLHEAILLAQHAHLLGGGDGWNPKHLVAHIVSKMVPPRDVRPKTSAMFARMMNIVLTAPGGRVAGAAAVRAYRCAAVLRHLMEGMPDAVVTKCVQDEYELEMKYVFSRKEVYERTTRGGTRSSRDTRGRTSTTSRERCSPISARRDERWIERSRWRCGGSWSWRRLKEGWTIRVWGGRRRRRSWVSGRGRRRRGKERRREARAEK